MAALSLQTVNRIQDAPQILAQHLVASGEIKVGGKLAGKIDLIIYSDRAKIFTKIEKYSNLPSEVQEKMDWYFKNVSGLKQGIPIFVFMPGPLRPPGPMSLENFNALVKTQSGSITYPLVKSVTWENSLAIPDSPQVQGLLSHVKRLAQSFFPNQTEFELI